MPDTSTLTTLADFARASYHLINEKTGKDYNVISPGAEAVYEELAEDWRMLEADDLNGINARNSAGSDFRTGISGGIFTRNNGAALVGVQDDTLVLSFRGTNDDPEPIDNWLESVAAFLPGLADLFFSPDVGDWVGKDEHWEQFEPLLDALRDYVRDSDNGINHVLVTGHSLGASMVTKFMDTHDDGDWGGVDFQAITFANPGYSFIDDDNDSRIHNLIVEGDQISAAHSLDNIIDTLSGGLTSLFGRYIGANLDGSDKHSMELYRVLANLLEEHGLDETVLAENWDGIHAGVLSEAPDENDFLAGLLKDRLQSDDRSDTLRDLLLGGEKSDKLFGGRGADWLLGGTGDDTLKGENGDDSLYGDKGADRLFGGAGNDLLSGGRGDDTYIIAIGDGKDRQLDTDAKGDDLIRAKFDLSTDSFDLRRAGDSVVLRYGTDDSLTVDFTGTELMVERLKANDGPARSFSLDGLAEDAARILLGADGADSLKAGKGKDILSGGLGDDLLNGGKQADIYLFAAGDGQDSIKDKKGDDLIRLWGESLDDVSFARDGNDLTISYGAGDTLTISKQFVDGRGIEHLGLEDQILDLASDEFLLLL